MNTSEEILWEESSSQVLNLGTYIGCGLVISGLLFVATQFLPIFYFGIPLVLLYALWSYLQISSQRYRLTNERIIMQTGVLSKTTDELELYRVKDHRLEQPFFLRMFGLGNIILITSDQLNDTVILAALKDTHNLRESIRRLVEARRRSRGVRELDTN